ncbi:DUF871 domain-containing protein [Lactococcus lactis]|jgi:uncharacterized protein|uniref:DUF871 domain-containing protein n=1 Tax=Lactococcus lactis subsp. lactis TaxID=1360 RepID=A0A0V8CP34_LACLL|nr:MupG family TIM beta-alpha barrel fold protein [Lactococcus lactis]KSU03116.1 Outer surface protein of unknown function cellobiose operon [Lactococcus lactis subsp. lactis]BDH84284.1 outer surface protein [Lactococcus lactis]
MRNLGISLYPEKTDISQDIRYIELAKKYGFSRIFMNLLLFKVDDIQEITSKIKKILEHSNSLGYETYIDVNPFTLKALNIEYNNLTYFKELGVSGIRLDMGFSGKEEAEMTKNKQGLKIEINMSNDDHYLDRIFDYGPNTDQLTGCHNFFPQAYTGLSVDQFKKCSIKFIDKHLKTAAFVTSQHAEIGPWTIQEGLCSIEEHRNLSIKAQVTHLKMLGLTDDIIIGNAYATEQELKEMSEAFFSEEVSLTVMPERELTHIEREILEENSHTYRGDRSEFMIRSSMTRFTYRGQSIPADNNKNVIEKGDVLILNDDYGQYKGELQIALKARPTSSKINKIGSICNEELILLDSLQPFSDFKLKVVNEERLTNVNNQS